MVIPFDQSHGLLNERAMELPSYRLVEKVELQVGHVDKVLPCRGEVRPREASQGVTKVMTILPHKRQGENVEWFTDHFCLEGSMSDDRLDGSLSILVKSG